MAMHLRLHKRFNTGLLCAWFVPGFFQASGFAQPIDKLESGAKQGVPKERPPVHGSLVVVDPVTVALDWTPNTNHAGLYIAQTKKFFDSVHIKPTLVQPTQTTATQLVVAQKAEFGVSFMNDVLKAREEGLPVVAIAAIVQENTSCFAWRDSTPITDVKSFEGKRYGGWGSPEEEQTLKYLMSKAGADFKKLKIVTTGVSDFVLSTPKHADFMWIYKGWDGIKATLAGVKYKTLCLKDLDAVFNHPSPLIVTSEALLKNKPELVKRFLQAASQGYEAAIKNPEAAAKDMSKRVPELDAKLVKESLKYLSAEYAKGAPQWGVQSPEAWIRYRDWALAEGLIKKKEPLEAIFNNTFLPKR